jgi:hypothetical protein
VGGGHDNQRAGQGRSNRPLAEARAGDLAPIIKTVRAIGARSLRAIAAELNRRGIPTSTGAGEWHGAQLRRVLARM